MASIIDTSGARQQIDLNVGMYREAANRGMSFSQYINTTFDASADHGTAFSQLMASEGIFIGSNSDYGVRASSMHEILNGRIDAAVTTKEGVPASRILFPAAVMAAIEDKLTVDLDQTPDAFEGMIAVDDSITGDRYERPVLNFTRPESARSKTISQLAMPTSMLLITASDTTRKIPTMGLGLEIAEQALKATTLDIVGLSLARQAKTERNERAEDYILSLLNGDKDMEQLALSGIAGKVVTSSSLDAASAGGKLTQRAWIKWLAKNSKKRQISHVVTDLDGLFAIENREGRPTNQTDNPNSVRIDTLANVINPGWTSTVKVFLTDNPAWPAGTIMGLDSRYAVHRVKSLSASYEAIENLVMRRSTQMRFDHGEIVYRLFDEAFEVLVLQ